VTKNHIFANYGYIAWFFAVALIYSIYYCCEQKKFTLYGAKLLHTIAYLILTAIVCFESHWLILNAELATCWAVVAVAAVLIVALQTINRFSGWPIASYPLAYQKNAAFILISGLILWSFAINFSVFLEPSPLPYIPLLNPIDIAQAIALLVVLEWYKRFNHTLNINSNQHTLCATLSAFCFIWFNVILFKTIHIVNNVPYHLSTLYHSTVVQMAVSISWTLIGLAVMVIASKKQQRQLWMIGAALTAIVVVKLFLLDLVERETIERIISFMVVGILLLVIGYFSPVPPKTNNVKISLEK